MKRYRLICIVFITCISVFSCKKDNGPDSASLTGTWEQTQVQNGMIPTISYPSGNGNILKFTDTTYENYNNHILVKSGTYRLITDTTVKESVGLEIPSGQYTTRIIFDDITADPKTFLQINGTNLFFISGFFPTDAGGSASYRKIN